MLRRFTVVIALPLLLAVALTDGRFEARASHPPGWDDATHGRDATPDYARVFPPGQVTRLDITIASADWAAMLADMTDMAGPFGGQRITTGGGGFGGFVPPAPAAIAACAGRVEGNSCTLANLPGNGRCEQSPTGVLACVATAGGGGRGGVPGGGGAPPAGGAAGRDDVEFFPRTPLYVAADVTFDGVTFRHVGIRFKGNSSLSNAWRAGVEKLPLRLNFDELEGEHPDILDQTFFGFPNLNLTNNATDASFLRAKVVGDLFREAGLPTARTGFVSVYVNRGAGPEYFGLYTLIEVPDRPMLESAFGSAAGNLYKPLGTGARWTIFDEESFPKKTNSDDEDWTDIQDAIDVLNESRQSPAVWRARLEARFNVNGFLRWLALNTIVGNNDAYGGLSPHNYWLYGSPRHRDRLFWIPWDHDLAMSSAAGGTAAATIDLFHSATSPSWPLIRFLIDDPVYRQVYRRHVEELLVTVFEPAALTARFASAQALIAPYVVGASGEQPGRTFLSNPAQFAAAVSGNGGLMQYVTTRSAAVRAALAGSQP